MRLLPVSASSSRQQLHYSRHNNHHHCHRRLGFAGNITASIYTAIDGIDADLAAAPIGADGIWRGNWIDQVTQRSSNPVFGTGYRYAAGNLSVTGPAMTAAGWETTVDINTTAVNGGWNLGPAAMSSIGSRTYVGLDVNNPSQAKKITDIPGQATTMCNPYSGEYTATERER